MLLLQAEHFRVKKQTSMLEFKQLVAQKLQVPVDRQRYWHWATRQNQSVRVSCPVGLESDNVKVCDIRVGSNASLCLTTSCFIIADSALKLLCAPLLGFQQLCIIANTNTCNFPMTPDQSMLVNLLLGYNSH